MHKIKVTLLTGRTIDQGTTKEHGKLTEIYQENVAICEMDPSDLEKLDIRENTNIKITTKHGTVVVKAKKSKRSPHKETAYMPYGLWANIIADPETHGTGMPSFKGIIAEIQPAQDEDIPTIPQILRSFRKNGQ